jgi:hypothetical protein
MFQYEKQRRQRAEVVPYFGELDCEVFSFKCGVFLKT